MGRGALLAQTRNEAHRCGDANERRATHLQLADRIRHRLCTLKIAGDFGLGERTLIEDTHGTRWRP